MARKRKNKPRRTDGPPAPKSPPSPPRFRRLTPHLDMIAAGLTAFVFVLHLFLTNEYFIGSGTDMVSADHPMHVFATSWLSRGVLPLWNPFVLGGIPFQAGVHGYFYPGLWTGVVLPAGLDIKVGLLLHLVIAATGGVWFARRYVSSRVASYLCGVVFACSGFAMIHLFAGHRVLVATAAYLPWIAGAIDRVIDGQRRHLLTGFVLAGLMVLCGHYHIIFIGMGGVLVFVLLGRLVTESDPACGKADKLKHAGRATLIWGGFLLVGVLIASVQILPMLDTMGLSQRSEGGLAFAASYSSAPPNVLTYLLPNLFGNRVDVPFVGGWFYWESLGYIGIIPCVLVLYGLIALPFRRWFPAAVVIAIGLVLSFGAHTPLFKVYLALVPMAELFRSPGRFCLLVTLFGSLLAAQALDVWMKPAIPTRRQALAPYAVVVLALAALVSLIVLSATQPSTFSQWMTAFADTPSKMASYTKIWPRLMGLVRVDLVKAFIVLTVTAVLLLVGPRRPQWAKAFGVVLVILVAGDLFHSGHRFLGTAPQERFHWPTDVTAMVHKEGGPAVRLLCPPETRWQNFGAMHEIGNPAGYDMFLVDRYTRYLNRSKGRDLDKFLAYARIRRGGPLIRHLGPQFLLAYRPLKNGRNRTVSGFGGFEPYKRVGQLHIYRDEEAPPRAALVHAVEVIEDEVKTYQRMEGSDFDIRNTVLVESALPADFPAPEPVPGEALEKCEITAYEVNRVEFDVEAASNGILVLSDSYFPGWSASVDGEEVPMVHANRVMRAVPVPAGQHKVVMTYLPTSFVVGAIVSAVSVLALIMAIVIRRYTRKPTQSPFRPRRLEGSPKRSRPNGGGAV